MSGTGSSNNGSTPTSSQVAAAGANVPAFEQWMGQFGSGVGTTTNQIVPPGAAESAYQYENYVANLPVQIGPAFAAMLGIPDGVYTGAQLQGQMADLSQAQIAQVQSYLKRAGFYVDSQGSPLTGVVAGSLGNQDFIALANAVSYANNAKTSIDNATAQRIGSGAGALAEQPVNNAIVGGGNVYEIKLDDPRSMYAAARSVSQALLGRDPTQSELDQVASMVRSGQFAQQMTENQSHEQMSQQQYQAEIAKRNAPFQSRTALGAVPTGPFDNPGQAAVALLQYMGGNGQTIPVSQSNVQFILALSNKLNLDNPQGFQQSVQKLQSFGNIQAALASGDATGQLASNPGLQADLKKFGAGDITSKAASQSDAAQKAIASITTEVQGGQTMVPHQTTPGDNGIVKNSTGPAAVGYQQSPASPNSTPAADATGNTDTNSSTIPGDQYINPITTQTTNPMDASQATAYIDTHGPNRIQYAANNYLNAFNAVIAMIKNGGPTT